MIKKPPKKRKCRWCKDEYSPSSSTQTCCKWQCALALSRDKQVKKDAQGDKETRKWQREKRIQLKSRSDWLRDAQAEFNKYIRLRDKDKPCISCGTRCQQVQYCAGHFFTRGGYPELRFNEDNVHKQCNKRCNLELSGAIQGYRKGLIERIGQKRLDILEGPHEPKKYTIPEIQEIKRVYREKAKQLEGEL